MPLSAPLYDALRRIQYIQSGKWPKFYFSIRTSDYVVLVLVLVLVLVFVPNRSIQSRSIATEKELSKKELSYRAIQLFY